MQLTSLTAVSPIDGRYHSKTTDLGAFFSEYALIKYRVLVEIEYFIGLCELPLPQLAHFDKTLFDSLRSIYQNFTEADANAIKTIERTTNHDVKAVEYFIKSKFDELDISHYKEFIHFALTSQDINNTSMPLMLKDAINEVYTPALTEIISLLNNMAIDWSNIPMLTRTHGQPASPTLLGKEIRVFVERLEVQLEQLLKVPHSAKFGGATGNFNAHYVSYPDIDWRTFANGFVDNTLGLKRSQYTTQIEHYDNLGAAFHALARINTILIDFSRDVWTYISQEYFKQKVIANEVGSSAMPHKVNPIDFENAEGNFGLANAIFNHLAAKLPISRLQRDLTDSTVSRNIGVPFGHTLIAFKSLVKGISKLELNTKKLNEDLDNNWAVVSEAIQNILRREDYPQPYEALKALTRGKGNITEASIKAFIEELDVTEAIKAELRRITPFNYVGMPL
ncbi:MAG: adenylosuccinate lyase [Saprospiraceae bacterium]